MCEKIEVERKHDAIIQHCDESRETKISYDVTSSYRILCSAHLLTLGRIRENLFGVYLFRKRVFAWSLHHHFYKIYAI